MVTDLYDCGRDTSFMIGQPDPITTEIIEISEYNGYNVSCSENADAFECDGEISLIITGGIPFNSENLDYEDLCDSLLLPLPEINMNSYYQYSINTGPQQVTTNNVIGNSIYATIDGMCAGNNTINIFDQNGCMITFDLLMTGPDVFEFTTTAVDVSCFDASDGLIEIDCEGGVLPYSYEWWYNGNLYANTNNGSITDLNGGEYVVYVTDQNNCSYSNIINIYEPPAFEIETNISNPQCDELVGYVEFDVSGSHDGEYQYMVYDQVTNPVINNYNENDTINLISGEHTFIFIDTQGCESDSILVTIDPASEDCLQIPSLFTPNGDSQNDVWQIGGIEDYPSSKINIYNRWGQLVFTSNGNYFGNEWDGTHNGTPLPFAVYYYVIDPINENGKTYHGGVTIKR
jgi:gliding motility-associated-like protein